MFEYKAEVVSITDGDTIKVDIDLGFGVWLRKQAVRLARINAPEKGTETGNVSKMYLTGVIPPGTLLTIRTTKGTGDKDKYGRWLADLFFENGACINDQMVQHNVAKYWNGQGERPV